MIVTMQFDLDKENEAKLYRIASHSREIQDFFYHYAHDMYEDYVLREKELSVDADEFKQVTEEEKKINTAKMFDLRHHITFFLCYLKGQDIEFLLEKNPDENTYYQDSYKILEWPDVDGYFDIWDYNFECKTETWRLDKSIVSRIYDLPAPTNLP